MQPFFLKTFLASKIEVLADRGLKLVPLPDTRKMPPEARLPTTSVSRTYK